jgi:16S rRNA (adenine1518-N6/adenine1519-N6)-dimethyltransferase
MVALVQREVAERIVRPSKTSLLSLMVALSSKSVEILSRVSANSFYPIPKVESAILKIVPMTPAERLEKWGIEPEEIMQVARLGFAHPRKLLASNLKSLRVSGSGLRDLGIDEKARAEDLLPDDWARLTLHIHNPSSLPLS